MAYDRAFYDFLRTSARASAEEIVPLLLETTGARSVVDVGCGTGTWLAVFSELGILDFIGVDGAHVDAGQLEISPDRFLACDLNDPAAIGRTFDLALCLETAEHLSPASADGFVRFLASLAPIVCFSAAIPRQGGVDHVNEQWPTYWVGAFERCGFEVIDCIRPAIWSNERVAMWYAQNCLLFAAREAIERSSTLAAARAATHAGQLNLVHPSVFLFHSLGIDHPVSSVPLEPGAWDPAWGRAAHEAEAAGAAAAAPEVGVRQALRQLWPVLVRAIRSRLGVRSDG